MTIWDDLFKAETSTELFILLSDILCYLSGNPETKIRRIRQDEKLGLRLQVLQSLAVENGHGRHLCRPITQEFILLQDGTLSWEMKLTGEKIVGLVDIQARLRQVMEDSRQPLMFAEQPASLDTERASGRSSAREERVLVGYIPKNTEPTLEFTIPRQTNDLAKKKKTG